MRNAYKILARKLEVRELLGRPMHRSENNIKMDFKEIGVGIWTRSVVFNWGYVMTS
jgi:hypothetical protein